MLEIFTGYTAVLRETDKLILMRLRSVPTLGQASRFIVWAIKFHANFHDFVQPISESKKTKYVNRMQFGMAFKTNGEIIGMRRKGSRHMNDSGENRLVTANFD
jgi:hypothetical protein